MKIYVSRYSLKTILFAILCWLAFVVSVGLAQEENAAMSKGSPAATPYPLFDPERDVNEIPAEFLLNFVPKPIPPEASPEEIAEAQRLFIDTFQSRQIKRAIPGYPTAWDNENLIIQVCKDYGVANRDQVAYILATAQHETAHFDTLQEYGCSSSPPCSVNGCTPIAGNDRPYGNCDPIQRYYGRGYVQLTWRSNYQKYTDITGRDLINDPDILIREPALSAWIMVDGMMNGRFTGAKLPTYVNDTTVDFYNARRTVNGTAAASTVQSYAQAYQQDSRVMNYSLGESISFNEYSGILANTPAFQLTNRYFYSWMDSTAGNYTWIMIGNPSTTATAHVTVKLAGTVIGTYSVNPGEIVSPRSDGQHGGLIEVASDINIFTTQRTLLVDGGFSEYAGIPANNLTNRYFYSWMDSTTGNYTWTMISNPSTTATAHVTVKLAGTVIGTYSVNPGEIVSPRFDGQHGGPIEVASDINIFTTQRTLIGVGFSEYAGIPANNLTNHYYYSWMDSIAGNFTWTMIANPSATAIAHVTIKLAGTVVGTYSLNPGEIAYPRFDGQRGGPIEVTSDINIFTTQRAQTKISNASSAKIFMKEAQLRSSEFKYQQGLSNHFYYSWMDSTGAGKFYTWTMIANPSATAIAHVTIKLAGTVVGTYSLNPGEIAYPRFDGQQGGPIEVVSDINIFTTQRTLVNGAFSEYVGIPATNQETNSYLLWTK